MLEDDPRFATFVAPLLEMDGDVVSSSRIRRLVMRGDVEQAARLLGAHHTLSARVGSAGTLSVEDHLCVPPAGRYNSLIDGLPTTVTIHDNRIIEARDAPRSQEIELSFLKREPDDQLASVRPAAPVD